LPCHRVWHTKPGCACCSFPKHASFHFDRRDGNLIPFWVLAKSTASVRICSPLSLSGTAWRATVLVSLVWGSWHLALWIYSVLAGSASPLDVDIQVGVNIAAAFALSFPFAYCYFLSANVLPCALLHVLIDNFLIFVFEANHGLTLSGDFLRFYRPMLIIKAKKLRKYN